MDVIRCDEQEYLVWKWRPSGEANSTNKENAIRYGSSLRVKDGEMAVFVYPQKDGENQAVDDAAEKGEANNAPKRKPSSSRGRSALGRGGSRKTSPKTPSFCSIWRLEKTSIFLMVSGTGPEI